MYSTCLFCNQSLGRNELVEAFPVGRRLAFDAAKGRLWVVCPKCERWNLTPLEERWEAIEQCERLFRDTRLRVSTDQIGLAKLKEGLVLVRIGEPQRPELAAWRYGDQFGRRRRKVVLGVAGSTAVFAGMMVGMPLLPTALMLGVAPAIHVLNLAYGVRRMRRVTNVPVGGGVQVAMSERQMGLSQLTSHGPDDWSLRVVHASTDAREPWWRRRHRSDERTTLLTGADAVRAAGAMLPAFNGTGAGRRGVQKAVGFLEEARDAHALFAYAAKDARDVGARDGFAQIPPHLRLALEMAAHEEHERRALEGELHELARAWRDAEEIAKIADDLFLPEPQIAERPRHLRPTPATPTSGDDA